MSFNLGSARRGTVTLLTAIAFVVAGLPGAWAQNLTIFAAASLRNALDEADKVYQSRSGEKAAISYAASSALSKQIENGAPADIFISADLDWMDYVEKRGLLKGGSRTNLLRNEIVLIVPADSKATLTIGPRFPLGAQLGDGRLAMADPDSVPAGKYGKAALESLGVWESVANKIARAEDVRAALNFVSRGEAPFGIVYRTDAAADKNVKIIGTFPANSHPPIIYPAAIVAASKHPGAAKYYDFLKTPAVAEIFRKHGFVPY